MSFDENKNPELLRPLSPSFLWTDNPTLQDFESAVLKFRNLKPDRRERMDEHIALCDHFLNYHWKIWTAINENERLSKIATYLFSKLEESLGVKTIPLKGNHRIASSFMWANILDYIDERWIPSAFRLLVKCLNTCCTHLGDGPTIEERLTLSPNTPLCQAVILPLFDTDFTCTFGRRDNLMNNGSRLEHDLNIFASDAHSRRHVEMEKFIQHRDGFGITLSHVPVWLEGTKNKELASVLREVYLVHFNYTLLGKCREGGLDFLNFTIHLIDEHGRLQSLGEEIQSVNLHKEFTQTQCGTKRDYVFGLGKCIRPTDPGANLLKFHHRTREEHEDFQEWSNERKRGMYVEDIRDDPTTLEEHYAACFLRLIHELILHPNALSLVPQWLKYMSENYFLNDVVVELLNHAHLSGNDGLVKQSDYDKIGEILLEDESKHAAKSWVSQRSGIVAGLGGALRIAMNDLQRDVVLTQGSYSVEDTRSRGVGRPMKWWFNALADYHAGLPSPARVNATLLSGSSHRYQFFTEQMSLKSTLLANGRYVYMKNFQRITDALVRHPSLPWLGDLISFTLVSLHISIICRNRLLYALQMCRFSSIHDQHQHCR